MSLHSDIAGIAGQRPALFVGAGTLSGVSFDTFRNQISTMVGVHIPAVTENFYAMLLTAETVGGAEAKNIKFGLRQDGDQIYLEANGGLKLAVEYGAAKKIDGTDDYDRTPLGQVLMLVKDVYVTLSVSVEKIAASPSNAVFIPTIERVADFSAICTTLNLDQTLVSRVEGMIAYSSIQTIVASLFRVPQEISLSLLFPGITLLGQIEALVTPNAEAVLIIPGSGVEAQPGSLCECSDSIDGIGPTRPGRTTTDGRITIGGPTVPDPRSVKMGRRMKGIGDTGFYMPIALAETITAGPPPITKTYIGQSGFLGWDAQAIVDWKVRKTWFDVARGAVMVQWWAHPGASFASGNLWVDLGKLGRYDVGSFTAKQQPVPSTFTVALFPDAIAGVTTLHPVIEAIEMGDFFIEPSIKSLAMAPFSGPGAFIAFIVEMIIYRIVAHNIPIELTRRLSEYLLGLAWKIEDLSYWGKKSDSIKANTPNPVVLWDATTDSMVISGLFGD